MEKREEKQEEEESIEPRFNAVTEAALREAEDIASGKIKVKGYSDLDELFRDLKADDDEDDSYSEEKTDVEYQKGFLPCVQKIYRICV